MTAFTGEIHPFADMFPMLDEESLQALAEDIKLHGLREPIIIDKQGRLIDGRNRLAACRIAEVQPRYIIPADLNGDVSIAALIVSRNLQRRDLTQGQKAHLAVRLQVSCKQDDLARIAGIPQQVISQATIISEYAPHLVPHVIDGSHPHSKAYGEAKKAREDSLRIQHQMKDLQSNRPDLIDLVATEKLTLEEALVVRDNERAEQQRREKAERENAERRNLEWHQALANIEGWHHPVALRELKGYYEPLVYDYTAADMHRIADLLHDIANRWDEA